MNTGNDPEGGLRYCEKPVDCVPIREFGYWASAMGRWYKEGIPKEAGSPDDMVDGFVTRDPALWSDDEKPPEINVFNYFKLDLGAGRRER